MSNYKIEVENTEKLNGDINSAFTEINTELKKDDNLTANDLFDVDRCIEELKMSRKRWATQSCLVETSDGDTALITVDISNLNFTPRYAFSTNFLWGYFDGKYMYYNIYQRDSGYFTTSWSSISNKMEIYYSSGLINRNDKISIPQYLEIVLFE